VVGLSGCLVLLAALPLVAQNRYTPIQPIPMGDVFLNLPTSHMSSKGTWETKFSHRFNQSINQGSFSDQIHSLFGLDSNADVGIGLSYTMRPDLQFSFYRSNALDDIEFGARYLVVQQAPAVPISLAARIGGDWRTEKDVTDRSSGFAQFILSRQFGRRAEISVIPTYVTNAGRAVGLTTSTSLFSHAFNVPVAVAVMLTEGVSVVGEVIPMNRDLPREMRGDYAWALGLKSAIGGHFFEILLTNSNATHADQYVTSTYMGSPLRRSDLHLGFNIERRFGR
jgi:hypothetical protein